MKLEDQHDYRCGEGNKDAEEALGDVRLSQLVLPRLVKTTADKILSALAISCPKFTTVVIETRGEFGALSSRSAFLRSKQIDLHGHETVLGMAVEPHMVKHYEPCSDILEPVKFVFA